MLRARLIRCCVLATIAKSRPPEDRPPIREAAYRMRARQQFQNIDGWQEGEDPQFDQYVADRRREKSFEAFDQRVERAYNAALRVHRAEVWNGIKRSLKSSGGKFDHQCLEKAKAAVAQRTEWLREVFAQIDADYRSGDGERAARASHEVQQALKGEPGDYMRFVLERKQELRLAGPKSRGEVEAAMDSANEPPVSDEEVNRYAALRTNMSALEAVVKERFGRAGADHWSLLQREKDAEYLAKMQMAAEKYKELIEQQTSYEEANSTLGERLLAERVLTAQARFKAAMELEEQREKLIEAHKEMQDERHRIARDKYKLQLQRAARMREEGHSSDDVLQQLKLDSIRQVLTEYNEQGSKEQMNVMNKKRRFLDIIALMEESIERREGEALMSTSSKSEPDSSSSSEHGEKPSGVASLLDEARQLAESRGDTSAAMTKKALWDVINEDTWEDPFRTIHQARLDARATHDESYKYVRSWNLRLGKKANRGPGDFLAGGGNEHKQLNDPWIEGWTFAWGLHSAQVHNLDGDGSKKYFVDDTGVHVADPKTGDTDYRYEKRMGQGAKFTGPKFYKMGHDSEAHPRNRTIHPTPVPKKPAPPGAHY